ncbi:MAG: hypothetical protein V4482_06850, partial [Pseudomonadota bacterium]
GLSIFVIFGLSIFVIFGLSIFVIFGLDPKISAVDEAHHFLFDTVQNNSSYMPLQDTRSSDQARE